MGARATARWIAVRALAEGAVPTPELLAAATGLSVRSLLRRAEAEGWTMTPAVESEDEASAAERIDRVLDFLMREVERIGVASQTDGAALDKGRLDGVWAMIRAIEKVDSFSRERAGDHHSRSDAELADVLRRIDDRIVELARELARDFASELGGDQSVGA